MFWITKSETKRDFQSSVGLENFEKKAFAFMLQKTGNSFMGIGCKYICSDPLHFPIGKVTNLGTLLISGLSRIYFNRLVTRNNLMLYFNSELLEKKFPEMSQIEFEKFFKEPTKAVGNNFSKEYEDGRQIEVTLGIRNSLEIPIKFYFEFKI